jgi:COP9 signalosome complex subunit 4
VLCYIRSAATTCSILAPAGPARLHTLASLHRDDRTPILPTYTILSKMFLENIIRPAEVVEFEKGLMPHQLARLPAAPKGMNVLDDSDEEEGDVKMVGGDPGEKVSTRMAPETVLDRAVMEHNLLSCAKVKDARFSFLLRPYSDADRRSCP